MEMIEQKAKKKEIDVKPTPRAEDDKCRRPGESVTGKP